MASSWNKGTLVGQTDQPVKTNVIREKQPSQEEGKSFLETVLDEAASALATGGSYVADVAESAYDLLPESEDIIENYYNLYLWDGICIHSNIHRKFYILF